MPSMHTSSSFALASVLAATSDSLVMKTAYYGAATFVGLFPGISKTNTGQAMSSWGRPWENCAAGS